MKYEVKQRRKKLKRKIWVAMAGLVVLGGFTAWTMDIGRVSTYGWQPNATNDLSLVALSTSNGGMAVGLRTYSDVKIGKEDAQSWQEYTNKRKRWHYALANTNGPYLDTGSTSHDFKFAGFQVNYFSRHIVGGSTEFDDTSYVVLLPIWVWAIPPALLIVLWGLQLRRVGRKDSAFPVITK